MNDITWQDPPPDGRAGRDGSPTGWAYICAALRERPNEWALVVENTHNSVAATQKRMNPGFEFVTRKRPEYAAGRADIYGRYVGGESA